MKKQALAILAMASLSLMLAVVPAYADPDSEVQANVPFDFIVGDNTYPAGSTASKYPNPGLLLMLRTFAGKAVCCPLVRLRSHA